MCTNLLKIQCCKRFVASFGYQGEGIKNLSADTALDCQQECLRHQMCDRFTWREARQVKNLTCAQDWTEHSMTYYARHGTYYARSSSLAHREHGGHRITRYQMLENCSWHSTEYVLVKCVTWVGRGVVPSQHTACVEPNTSWRFTLGLNLRVTMTISKHLVIRYSYMR